MATLRAKLDRSGLTNFMLIPSLLCAHEPQALFYQYEGVTTMAKDITVKWAVSLTLAVSPLDPENEEQHTTSNISVLDVNVHKPFDRSQRRLTVFTLLQGIWHRTIRDDEVLDFESVKTNFEKSLDWLTDTYVNANIIHYIDWQSTTTKLLFKWPSCQLTNALDSVSVVANTVDTFCYQVCNC